MKGKQKILMAFSEVAPFSKTGGLGDVGGGLPKALKEMGHDVRVITPQYRIVNERKYILRDVIRLQNIIVPLGKENLKINVKSAFLPNSKVNSICFIVNPKNKRVNDEILTKEILKIKSDEKIISANFV